MLTRKPPVFRRIVLSTIVSVLVLVSAPPAIGFQILNQWITPVAPGLAYIHYKLKTNGGRVHAYVLVLDIQSSGLNVRPALARFRVGGVDTLSSICRDYRALGGINGSFFDIHSPLPLPIGFIMIDGRVVFLTPLRKLTFGLTTEGSAIFGVPDAKGIIYAGDEGKMFYVWGMNRPRKKDEVIVYTPVWGGVTGTNDSGIEFMVRRGVVQAEFKGNAPIPADGFVISLHGKSRDHARLLGPGASVRFVFSVEKPWATVYQALTGDKRLLDNGRNVVRGTSSRNARTAVGVTPAGRLVMAVVDQGGADYSVGMDFNELALFMRDLGVTDAISLDGGGSTTMVVGCNVVNRPKSGTERRVSNALMITNY